MQQSLQDFIIDKLSDLKCSDITVLDVSKKSSVTDHMIICTGNSTRHVTASANHLLDEAKKHKFDIMGDEGKSVGDWVVVDMGSVIVHIMQQESRALYELEKLWRE